MEITGKLIRILPDVQGESARGPWIRGGFVIETGDDYPRKVAFTAFGEERVAMIKNIPMGQLVQVNFNPESREFNEKWYTDLRCTHVQPFVPGQMPQGPATGYAWAGQPAQGIGGAPQAVPQPQGMPAAQGAPVAQPAQQFAQAPQMPASGEDDLPF